MDKALLDLYTDYLISSFRLTTATGMANLLNDAISHDKITRFLSAREFTSADLWHIVKPLVRQVERADGGDGSGGRGNQSSVLLVHD